VELLAVDQVEYGPAGPHPLLLLPKRTYTVRVAEAAGKTAHEAKVKAE